MTYLLGRASVTAQKEAMLCQVPSLIGCVYLGMENFREHSDSFVTA